MRTLILSSAFFVLGCEQLRTNNAGMVSPEGAGCPQTWAEADAQCRGTAAAIACPSATCVYTEMGDCPRLDQLCADAVASCAGSDGGWSCGR